MAVRRVFLGPNQSQETQGDDGKAEQQTMEAKVINGVPAQAFWLFVGIEISSLQRARRKQEASGTFHTASYRQWNRFLHSRIRLRCFIYNKIKEHRKKQREEQGKADYDPDSEDDQEFLKRLQEERPNDHLSEMTDRPTTGLKEPKPSSSGARKNETDVQNEYWERKRVAQREKRRIKRQAQAHRDRRSKWSEWGWQEWVDEDLVDRALEADRQSDSEEPQSQKPAPAEGEPVSGGPVPNRDSEAETGGASSSSVKLTPAPEVAGEEEVDYGGNSEVEDVEDVDDAKPNPKWAASLQALQEYDQKKTRFEEYSIPTSYGSEQNYQRLYGMNKRVELKERPGVRDEPELPGVPRAGAEGHIKATHAHWVGGVLLSKANKQLWYSFVHKQCYDADRLRSPTRQDVKMALAAIGFSEIQQELVAPEPEPRNVMGRSVGQYWFVDILEIIKGTRLSPEVIVQRQPAAYAEWKQAYHGTALTNLPTILKNGLRPAVNETSGKQGIYCEGSHRRENVLSYMCHHSMPGCLPLFAWAVVLELQVDRARGGTINGQWCQQPGSVAVTGCTLHAERSKRASRAGTQSIGSL